MDNVQEWITNGVLIIMVMLLIPAAWRVWGGRSAIERLQALDLTTNVLISVIVVLGIVLQNSLIIDIGIALAAFSFVSTLAITRFISEGRFF